MRVDFSDPDAGREINAWVKRKTSGKIEHIIDPSALNNGTALVLCNAIYFKGKWTTEFNPKKTEPAPFHISTNASDTVTVPMMQQQSDCKMISADDVVELIELPYSGRDLSMIILLPQDVGGLDGLEQMLTTDNLRTWLQRLDGARPEKTSVLLPRFKFTREFDLVNSLKALGMRSLFNVHDANLSGMDPTDNLFVSDAVHKALVEVNEEGTEAAAATRVTVKMRGMNHNRSFTADHPFIFLIRERGSGSILFLGRLVRPQPA
jgi:serpin B